MIPNRGTHRLCVFVVLLSLSATSNVSAQDDSDAFTFFGVAQPQGPATAAYLRKHQPMYLLDLCRQVKAGTLDPQSVANMVGGNGVLNALLAMDLDALYAHLTAAQSTDNPSSASLWSLILTNGGAAPPPPPEVPDSVAFTDVKPQAAPSQVVRVTSPADGSLQVWLASGSPFTILSMRSYDGLILNLSSFSVNAARKATSLSSQFARIQAPWAVPVEAGQDVDIEIGLPAGTVIPPDGLTSAVTFADPSQSIWTKTIPVTAQAPLNPDGLYVYVDFQKTSVPVIKPPTFVNGYKQPFLVTMSLANPFPPANVKGTVELASAPQGVSMPTRFFTLQASQTLSLPLTFFIDSSSPAWSVENKLQSFRLKVSYQTVPFLDFGSQTPSYGSFILYPGLQNWFAKGNAGPIDCQQDLSLFSTGTLVFGSTCGNYNFLPGRATEQIFLGNTYVGGTVYSLNPFERQFNNWSIADPLYQTNYLFFAAQPMLVQWDGCLVCNP